MSQDSLFDDGETDAAASEPRGRTALVFPTNPPNYRHFASHRLLGPRELFGEEDKYYEDLLGAAPGRLPLLRTPLSESIAEHVILEDPRRLQPVIFEVSTRHLPEGPFPALDADLNPVEASVDDEGIAAVAPPLVLPLSAVQKVHFLSEEDRTQVTATNKFENVPTTPEEITRVTPGLTGVSPLSAEKLISWLGELDAPEGPSSRDFRWADRRGGAALLAARAHPEMGPQFLSLASNGSATDEEAGGGSLPEWFSVLRADSFDAVPPDPDVRSFAAVKAAATESTPADWQGERALEDIRERLFEDELSEETVEQIDKGFARIREVLRNEDDFTGFSRNRRLPALQALMLFLIREKPGDVLAWPEDDLEADPTVFATAAAYSGLLHGRALLPLSLRDQGDDERLARAAARDLSLTPLPEEPRPVPAADEEKEEDEKSLEAVLLEADLSDGPHKDAALAVCRAMEWTDCVTSVLICPSRADVIQRLTQKGGYDNKWKSSYRVEGFAEVQHELDADLFREQLKEEAVPAKDQQEIGRRILGW